MKTQNIVAIIFLAITAILAVISAVLLPDTVVTQITFSQNPTTMPKITAVLLPTLIGGAASVVSLIAKNKKLNYLVVSGVIIVVFVLMLVINLIAK